MFTAFGILLNGLNQGQAPVVWRASFVLRLCSGCSGQRGNGRCLRFWGAEFRWQP
jgi:hypothetical protein